jgi:CTP synthase (UTP-ammonia lyase)
VLIGIVGDRQPGNRTHQTLEASLEHARADWEWVATDAVPDASHLTARYDGLWIAPASPYRSMDGALRAITAARERGVPLVGT